MGRSTGLAGPAEATAADTPRSDAPTRGGDTPNPDARTPRGNPPAPGGRRPRGNPTAPSAPDPDAPGTGTLGTARAAEFGEAAARVRDTLEDVFAAVAETAAETAALLGGLAGGPVPADPVTADLAALRPGLHGRLAGLPLVSGLGFVAAPGLLADVPAGLEWWQRGPDGTPRLLLLDLDPGHSAYSDYTYWDWYTLPRETGRRAVAGPYVDYLCSDEYGLTLSAPVTLGGRFVGVAAADVYLRHFEAAVLPALQRLPAPARLVNARGRVAASTDSAHLAGSLTKGPDFAAVLAGPPGGSRAGGLRLLPCAGAPLVLVTAED